MYLLTYWTVVEGYILKVIKSLQVLFNLEINEHGVVLFRVDSWDVSNFECVLRQNDFKGQPGKHWYTSTTIYTPSCEIIKLLTTQGDTYGIISDMKN